MYRSRYRNLILIGNGFDRWQDLPTSYEQFRQYYQANIEQILSDLGYTRHIVPDQNGVDRSVTAVELIYGNPFQPSEMPNDFFWYFEASLDQLDDQQLNQYFGRSEQGIASLEHMIVEAQTILRTAFCRWVTSLQIDQRTPKHRFLGDCFFINFNYTDTLEKRFGVDSRDIFHIHGTAKQPDSIIVGHASHPEAAFRELIDHHMIRSRNGDHLPRLQGLYAVEEALYRTDKHVEDNLDRLAEALIARGVHIEDIENIYVLGHSFSPPDLRYFEYLDKATRCGCDFDQLSAASQVDVALLAAIHYSDEELSEKMLQKLISLNIEYAAHHRDRLNPNAPELYPELAAMDRANGITYHADAAERAVKQRFYYEQSKRTHQLLERLAKSHGLPNLPEGCRSVLSLADYIDMGHAPRQRNATWHISYFSPEDEKRIKRIMKQFGQKRVELYHGIDACIGRLLHK